MPARTMLLYTLRALARLERAGGVRAPRLTEPEHIKWHRMRRKLGWADFIAILCEDLAEAFPLPFDLSGWNEDPLLSLDDAEAQQLVTEAIAPDTSSPFVFLRTAAQALGLPPGGAIADLPKVQAHQSCLELPGAGGRIAAHQVLTHGDLAFHDQFTFVAATEPEKLLIGLAAVEVRANPPTVLTPDSLKKTAAAGKRFDRVVGVGQSDAAQSLARDLDLDVRWS